MFRLSLDKKTILQSRLYDILRMQIKVKQKFSSDKDSMENPDSGRQSWSEHLGLDGLACLVPLGRAALLVTNSSWEYPLLHTHRGDLLRTNLNHLLKPRWSIQQAMRALLQQLLSKEKGLNPSDSYQSPKCFGSQHLPSKISASSPGSSDSWIIRSWMKRMGLLPTSSLGTSLTHI